MKKITNAFWILLPIVLIGYLIYKIAVNSFTDHFLGNSPKITKAVIINKKNYVPNHPVSHIFSYSYQFEVNEEKYTGNAHDPALQIGDSVEVEYNKEHPGINKPLHPKE